VFALREFKDQAVIKQSSSSHQAVIKQWIKENPQAAYRAL
jgi:hypothetical protein